MKVCHIWGIALAAVLSLVSVGVQAQTYIGSYQAWISAADLENSRGLRLSDPAQILRQDRANFHRFGLRDAADESDPWFFDAGARAILQGLVRQARLSPADEAAILHGNVLVVVDLFAHGRRLNQVRVTVLR